jgi:hypothetical protein
MLLIVHILKIRKKAEGQGDSVSFPRSQAR